MALEESIKWRKLTPPVAWAIREAAWSPVGFRVFGPQAPLWPKVIYPTSPWLNIYKSV